jgi:hypothetical protein
VTAGRDHVQHARTARRAHGGGERVPGFDALAAVLVPAKTPPDILKRMTGRAEQGSEKPRRWPKAGSQGVDGGAALKWPQPSSTNKWTSWAKVVKDNNIKAD